MSYRPRTACFLAVLGLFGGAIPAWAEQDLDCLPLYYMKSYAQALPLCQQAAAAGNDQAQYALAVMYAEGKGVRKNDTQAVRWLKAASKQGHTAARFQLQRRADALAERERLRIASKLWSQSKAPPAVMAKQEHASKVDSKPAAGGLEVFADLGILKSSRAKLGALRNTFVQNKTVQKTLANQQASRSGKMIRLNTASVAHPKAGDIEQNMTLTPSLQHESLNSAETAQIAQEMGNDMAEMLLKKK